MRYFARQPEPTFWRERDEQFVKLCQDSVPGERPSAREKLHGWQKDSRSLAECFHDTVREADEPRLCAYCDGALNETSPETIDHFLPEAVFFHLGLRWENLFPACVACNSTHKGSSWSCRLVRPDEPIEAWFEFDPDTGALRPAPDVERRTRARVRLTIRVFGLNSAKRKAARRSCWSALSNAWHVQKRDIASLWEHVTHGPYRFVAEQFLSAAPLVRA